MNHRTPIAAWPLPLLAGSLVLFTIHVCYLIAASQGHVAWCFPYIDSCTSISATGRQWPERALFKPLMTIAALLVAVVFWLGARWLAALGDATPAALRAQRALVYIGVLMTFAIVAYTAALGEAGDTAKLLRKMGVTLGFGLTYLGEILLLARLAALRTLNANHGHAPAPATTHHPVLRWQNANCIDPRLYNILFAMLALTLFLGIVSVLLSAFYAGYSRMDDAFEWAFALLLNLFLVVLALAWRASGFTLAPGLRER